MLFRSVSQSRYLLQEIWKTCFGPLFALITAWSGEMMANMVPERQWGTVMFSDVVRALCAAGNIFVQWLFYGKFRGVALRTCSVVEYLKRVGAMSLCALGASLMPAGILGAIGRGMCVAGMGLFATRAIVTALYGWKPQLFPYIARLSGLKLEKSPLMKLHYEPHKYVDGYCWYTMAVLLAARTGKDLVDCVRLSKQQPFVVLQMLNVCVPVQDHSGLVSLYSNCPNWKGVVLVYEPGLSIGGAGHVLLGYTSDERPKVMDYLVGRVEAMSELLGKDLVNNREQVLTDGCMSVSEGPAPIVGWSGFQPSCGVVIPRKVVDYCVNNAKISDAALSSALANTDIFGLVS